MPFKSKAQQRFMFANHPKIAERFARETPNMKLLPQKKVAKRYKRLKQHVKERGSHSTSRSAG